MGLAARRLALAAAVASAAVLAASLTANAEPWHCRHRRCHTTTTTSSTTTPPHTTTTFPPTTTTPPPVVSDDFNRATLGTGWTVNLGSVGLVNGDLALLAGNIAIASWNTDPGPDQFIEARVSPSKPSNLLVQVFCRRRTSDLARYGFGYDDDPNDATVAPQWNIKYDGVPSASTRLLATSTTATPLAAGDVLRLECTGSNPVLLKGYHNGALVLTATDSSPSRILSGKTGLVFRKWVSGAVTYPARAFTEFTAGGF